MIVEYFTRSLFSAMMSPFVRIAKSACRRTPAIMMGSIFFAIDSAKKIYFTMFSCLLLLLFPIFFYIYSGSGYAR